MPASPSFLSALLDKAVLGTANLNTRGVVCVAERHDCFDHHLAQLYTIKSLRKTLRRREGPDAGLAVGLEAFQRPHQAYLDRYVAGAPDYGLRELFRDVRWSDTWGYDPLHYAPILEDARLHGTRLVGLSPPDELLDAVTRVGSENLDRGTSAFLPTGGTDAGRRLDAEREQRLFANRRDSQQLLEVQNFRDEYMADSAALHYDHRRSRDGWLVLLAGSRHVAHRDGLPDRVARRVASRTEAPADDRVFRGVHTIIPETVSFPVKAACFPSSTYGDIVWYQRPGEGFDPAKINRAPRPLKA